MKQFAQFRQTGDFNLLDKKHIYLQNHIHHLEQGLGEIVWLKEERIVAMMEIIFEIIQWLDALADTMRDINMVVQDIF